MWGSLATRLSATAAMVATLAAVTGLDATPAGAAPRALPAGPMYGVTIDDVTDMPAIVRAEEALPNTPTTRVYLDVREPASYYAPALAALAPHSYVMGEILDSSDMREVSQPEEHERVRELLRTLGPSVDLWEVGNEVNGNWTGSYSTGAALVTDSYEQVTAAGGRSALTLYYNVGCGDGSSELDPIAYSERYLPASVRDGLDYVLLSYYQAQCRGRVLSGGEMTSYLEQLHALFPHARLGFGEVGLPNRVAPSTLAAAQQIISHYYSLAVNLPYYVGGYFYWYFREDAVPASGKPVLAALAAGFRAEHSLASGVSASAAGTSPLPAFSAMSTSTWAAGGDQSGWDEVWSGYGGAGVGDDPTAGGRVLALQPATATAPGITHSTLVTSAATFRSPTFTVPVRTVEQLRRGSRPNDWEVGWVLWDYQPDDSFYSVILKPTGWELDKETRGAETILRTGSSPTFPVGRWYDLTVAQHGTSISASVDGQPLFSTSDGSYTTGAIGLYCEDSIAHYGNVTVAAAN